MKTLLVLESLKLLTLFWIYRRSRSLTLELEHKYRRYLETHAWQPGPLFDPPLGTAPLTPSEKRIILRLMDDYHQTQIRQP